MQDLADEEAQGTDPDLDRPPGLSEAAGADIPKPLCQVWKLKP